MASGVQVISNAAQFLALAEHDFVVVDFNATWCGPCKVIAPYFASLPAKYPSLVFASADVDQNKEVAQQLKITTIPSFVFFHKGREVARIRDANVVELGKAVANHAKLAGDSSSSSSATVVASSSSSSSTAAERAPNATFKSLIPRGFDDINGAIEMKALEALNAITGRKGTDFTDSVRTVFSSPPATLLSVSAPCLQSDADSQLLFYVPFNNFVKLHTMLIQTSVPQAQDEEETRQRPARIKLWKNLPSVLSFDDVTSVPAVHESEISEPDEQGWSVVKLHFVHFQRVTSLVIFIEGEDEDEPTAINRILFVGESGDKLEMGSLAKPDDE
ncbi:PITH domain-containing protein [Limtongia smithiae]|uniref:PITH domain-containing protein n=1 Tax=Limtongia smithiae TaxID=1125753 RepID=UPI0034CFB47B